MELVKTHMLSQTKDKLEYILKYVEQLIINDAPLSFKTTSQLEVGLSKLFDDFENNTITDLTNYHEKCLSSLAS